jgi:hypothetical protein
LTGSVEGVVESVELAVSEEFAALDVLDDGTVLLDEVTPELEVVEAAVSLHL